MIKYIILEPDEADIVRGPSNIDPKAIISPIELTNGDFMISTNILTDKKHARHYAFLSTFPTYDYEDISYLIPQPELSEE